jgi:hypothetical protein
LRGPLPDRVWWVAPSPVAVSGPEPEALLALSVGGEGRLSGVLRALPARRAAPVVQQPLAFAACSTLHARTRVHASLTRARCPIVCAHLSRRPSAAPPGLQALLYQSLQWQAHRVLQQAHRVCISPPPVAPTAPPAHHPSRAGPAAAVWRPGRARRGCGRLRARPGKACARRAA